MHSTFELLALGFLGAYVGALLICGVAGLAHFLAVWSGVIAAGL